MNIQPIAHFRSPLTTKFGIPRQSGIISSLRGTIVFDKEYQDPEAIRGLDGFDYIWIIWGFSENVDAKKHSTVRPPRLGGNVRQGVFATRSPFRPNNIGLSSVRLVKTTLDSKEGLCLEVEGADLMDGTPVYDIKPYLPEFDSHPSARAGFVTTSDLSVVTQLLSQDPRPHYHTSPDRIYGMPYNSFDIRFRVVGSTVEVVEIRETNPTCP